MILISRGGVEASLVPLVCFVGCISVDEQSPTGISLQCNIAIWFRLYLASNFAGLKCCSLARSVAACRS